MIFLDEMIDQQGGAHVFDVAAGALGVVLLEFDDDVFALAQIGDVFEAEAF